MGYILGLDQSTQGTKAILVDEKGRLWGRADQSHRQIVNKQGWISHDLEEIYRNTCSVIRNVIEQTGIAKNEIAAIGISNQRETTAIWDRDGKPLNEAIVWQCSRAREIAQNLAPYGEQIKNKTGLMLSPFFPAAKMAWLLSNTESAKQMAPENLCLGTIDSWLIYRMTGGKSFKTDYSNASRTQLFNIHTLSWDGELCRLFGISEMSLAQVCDSNSLFGMTDLDGYFEHEIPIHSAVGDSHGALFGQGCHSKGMIKTTYGTGSSIMMNTGTECVSSSHGLVTSLAWGIDGQVNYVLEGNINYTGAVITWLKDELHLVSSPDESEALARAANPMDKTVLIPAFSGLSAPYWSDTAKAMIYGMSRTTGKNEIVKAALESIALQIQAVLGAMEKDSGINIKELRVDGGPTRNSYLMQLQSDLSKLNVAVAKIEELSAMGAACLAGIGAGIFKQSELFSEEGRMIYSPQMTEEEREEKAGNWNEAIRLVCTAAVR
ncbi:glycerol kinase [Clostridium sp. AM58-1XD]|uniref:FGGY-family carbohydrate kinase n=1 Tax=Clostridium sp. AM58-1XD TaxID=2292307 RepID=UPI000E489954|nr:glycerol kinase [Clostridium sp. AM58-1XD]RGY99055.1 glycerol kinase GlpK [Clostridium sp. AM58-1XD]